MPVGEEGEEEAEDSEQRQEDQGPDMVVGVGDLEELAGVTHEHIQDRTGEHPTGGAMVVLLDEEHPVQTVSG